MVEKPKSKMERLLHALIFEVLAIVLSVPIMVGIFRQGMVEMGVITIVLAIIAVLWNMIYNWCYDQLCQCYAWHKTMWTRLVHAVLFEGGLALVSLPLIAWVLQISFWEAVQVDVAYMLFYLVFTYKYNWAYDVLRARYWGRLG